MLSVKTDEVARSLTNRAIDMAFTIRSINQTDVEVHQIGSEALHLVLSHDHPMSKEGDISSLLNQELDFVVYYQTYYEMFQDHPLMNLTYKRRFLTITPD